MRIDIQQEAGLTALEFIDCLVRSTLSERRPVADVDRIAGMLQHADLVITARDEDGLLVGVSRAITDFYYCTYLSELAVDARYQGRGIGRRLIEETHLAAGQKTMLILLAAPAAESYYPHIGMTPHRSAWTLPRKD
jgi:GNAT superfamily N-acetyltransferase